jgi:hypothetical protein
LLFDKSRWWTVAIALLMLASVVGWFIQNAGRF